MYRVPRQFFIFKILVLYFKMLGHTQLLNYLSLCVTLACQNATHAWVLGRVKNKRKKLQPSCIFPLPTSSGTLKMDLPSQKILYHACNARIPVCVREADVSGNCGEIFLLLTLPLGQKSLFHESPRHSLVHHTTQVSVNQPFHLALALA